MEIIMISESKLKIMLSEEDMIYYELDCSCASYNNTETRRAFWSILDEVKHRTGFDAASDRVFIQLYPSKQGGCEIYVTKVGLLCTQMNKSDQENTISEQAAQTDGRMAFVFSSVRDMISACRLVEAAHASPKSNAWIDEAGVCYLFIDAPDGSQTGYICGIMNEYGNSATVYNASSYICEHGKLLCKEHAVEILSVF